MNTTGVKVDVDNMCIDRTTELGKRFAAFNDSLAKETNPKKREFMSKISAYVEASIIVENTMPEKEAKEAIEKLKAQMMEGAKAQKN